MTQKDAKEEDDFANKPGGHDLNHPLSQGEGGGGGKREEVQDDALWWYSKAAALRINLNSEGSP